MIDDEGFITSDLDVQRDLRYAIMRLLMSGSSARVSASELKSDAIMMALRNGIDDIPGMNWPMCHCGKRYEFFGSHCFKAKLRCGSGHILVADVLAFLAQEKP